MKTLLKPLLFILLILSFVQCSKDDITEARNPITNSNTIDLGSIISSFEISTYLSGYVKNEDGEYLPNIEITYKDKVTFSDDQGFFAFGRLDLNQTHANIVAKGNGYFTAFKLISPTPAKANFVAFEMVKKPDPVIFNSDTGGEVSLDDDRIILDFPAESIIDMSGDRYSGEVKIFADYIDPSANNFGRIMPGRLEGVTTEEEFTGLISSGMMTVELEDQSGNKLNIGEGFEVSFTMPAKASDPNIIPLWNFDETYGIWVEIGTAEKIGDSYIGSLTHFSTYNLDAKANPTDITLRICSSPNTPAGPTNFEIKSNNKTVGSGITDAQGVVNITNAPGDSNLSVAIKTACGDVEIPIDLETASSASGQKIELNLSDINNQAKEYSIVGTAFDCEDQNIVGTYIQLIGEDDPEIQFYAIVDENGFVANRTLCSIPTNAIRRMNASFYLPDNTVIIDEPFDIIFPSDGVILQNFDLCGEETDTVDCEFVIPFVDENLENEIKFELDFELQDTLRYCDIKDITELELTSANVSSLAGLQYFDSLNWLYLANNPITDLTPIANLPLIELEIALSNITDLSPLQSISTLLSLYMDRNPQITSLDGLPSGLVTLRAYDCNINNIDRIAQLQSLSDVDLSFNQISNLNALENHPSIKELELDLNQIEDLTPLKNISTLEILDLGRNNIATTEQLNNLPNLRILDLEENLIVLLDLANTNPEILDISDNVIDDISSLTNKTSLKSLDVAINFIDDITPLGTLTSLEFLNMVPNTGHNYTNQPIDILCNLQENLQTLIISGISAEQFSTLEECLPTTSIN